MHMGISRVLRIIATICFVLAIVGVSTPVLLVPLGLALWCGSTLVPWRLVASSLVRGAGVKLSPHTLRHTSATYLLYFSGSLGNSDVRTTIIYLHTQQRQEEEIAPGFGWSSDAERIVWD
jgi:hypothetical protein